MEREYWSLPQLAEEWGVSRHTVRHYVENCGLRAERDEVGVGHAYRVPDAERLRWAREVRTMLRPGGRAPTLPDGIVRRALVDVIFPNEAVFTTYALAIKTIKVRGLKGIPRDGFIVTQSVTTDYWLGLFTSPCLPENA